jgi:hypothetical protein
VTQAMELWVSYKQPVSLSRKSVKHGLTAGNALCLCNTVLHYRCHVVKFMVMTQCYINSVNIFPVNPSSTAYLNISEPCVLCIGRAYCYPPNVAFHILFLTNISTEYFKHAAHSPFFSSKCRLFHNATFFGSVLFTFYVQGVLKFKCKI